MSPDRSLKELESAQPLGDSRLAIDAVLFSCGGSDGSYLVAAQARRKLGMNNTIFCLRLPGVGVLMHPKHPDTTFFTGENTFAFRTQVMHREVFRFFGYLKLRKRLIF